MAKSKIKKLIFQKKIFLCKGLRYVTTKKAVQKTIFAFKKRNIQIS